MPDCAKPCCLAADGGPTTELALCRGIRSVDACIADLVRALNEQGMETVASCCGHGRMPGVISLADGREIIIARNYGEARQMFNSHTEVPG